MDHKSLLNRNFHQSSPISYKTVEFEGNLQVLLLDRVVLLSIELLSDPDYPHQSVETFQDIESCCTIQTHAYQAYQVDMLLYTQEYKKCILFLSSCPA
jgi:hypothetical protein